MSFLMQIYLKESQNYSIRNMIFIICSVNSDQNNNQLIKSLYVMGTKHLVVEVDILIISKVCEQVSP